MKITFPFSFFVAISIILTIAGCGGGGGGSSPAAPVPTPAPSLQSIAVTPASPVFAMGKTQQFVATGTYSDGSTLDISSTVTWSSATPTVASINASGLATGVAAGSSVIAAASGAITVNTTSTIYNPGTFTAAANLAHPRYMHTATLLPNGKVLVVGDGGGTLLSASTELYDPATNTWTSAGNTLVAHWWGHTATMLPNGKVLLVGGYGQISSGGTFFNQELANAELYDPATNTWTAAASMANPRQYHTATLLPNGKVLVAGGKNLQGTSLLVPINYLTSAELYDPATNTWTPASAMATAREFHTATLLTNGKVLIAGGDGFGGLTGAELYDPAANTWSAAGSIILDYAQTATLLTNGKVLVAGGADVSATSMPYANLYDPATNTWSAAGKLATARSMHTAVLLPNGRVLVAGGGNTTSPANVYASAELYDPATNAWYAAGNLVIGRFSHTATLLSNGKVLVAGGSVAGGLQSNIMASTELY